MTLTALRLSHFRSHRRTALTFDARPVAIHGPNGAGKTNLIEAISLLSPGRGLRRGAAEDFARRPEALGWKVMADLGGHEVETGAEAGSPRSVRIDGKAAPQTALARIARILWLVPAMDRLWIEGAEGRRRFLDRIAMSFRPDHAEAVLAYERAMRERNRLLKDMVRDPTWYGALESRMAEASEAITANRRSAIERLAGAPPDGFPVADLALTHAEELPDDLAAALADSRPRDMAAGRTLIGPHRADLDEVWAEKGMAARDCSTGEQKALLISLILANARALEGERPILLLDEVAAHLDADRRAALYEAILASGCQAFLTGTGPELFAELGARAQTLEVRDSDGVSEVVPA